jgi:hypothetical protein
MTVNAMAGDRDQVLEAGMNDHIVKPVDEARLFEVLYNWIKAPDVRQLEVTDTDTGADTDTDSATSEHRVGPVVQTAPQPDDGELKNRRRKMSLVKGK